MMSVMYVYIGSPKAYITALINILCKFVVDTLAIKNDFS